MRRSECRSRRCSVNECKGWRALLLAGGMLHPPPCWQPVPAIALLNCAACKPATRPQECNHGHAHRPCIQLCQRLARMRPDISFSHTTRAARPALASSCCIRCRISCASGGTAELTSGAHRSHSRRRCRGRLATSLRATERAARDGRGGPRRQRRRTKRRATRLAASTIAPQLARLRSWHAECPPLLPRRPHHTCALAAERVRSSC